MIISKAKTTLLIIFILISALIWAVKPAQAMKWECSPVRPVAIQGEIVEGRLIVITRYDRKCNQWVEVLEV